MFNVCYNCGQYQADKTIDASGPYAICNHCDHKHIFIYAPLLIICGPSSAGKSTVCQALTGSVDEVVMLDGDLLWRAEFNQPENQYRNFFETWLRMGKNIAQSGRPLLLCNAGAIPDNVEPCVERRYFSQVHYLALVCQDDVLIKRLQQRPSWRQSGDDAFVQAQLQFNQWFKQNAQTTSPPITLLDTSTESIDTAAQKVKQWIREKMTEHNLNKVA